MKISVFYSGMEESRNFDDLFSKNDSNYLLMGIFTGTVPSWRFTGVNLRHQSHYSLSLFFNLSNTPWECDCQMFFQRESET